MLRVGAVCLLVLAVGCGDLLNVAPPPVPLSALHGTMASAGGDGLDPSTLQAAVRLVEALPPHALAVLHLPDIGGAIRRFRKTRLHKLLQSPEMKSALGGDLFSGAVDLGGLGGSGGPGLDAQRLLQSFKGEFVIALEEVHVTFGKALPDVRVLAGISVSGAEQEAIQLVEFVAAMAAQQRGVKVEKGAVDGQGFNRIVGSNPAPWIVEVAVYRDALLVGYGRDTVTAAMERLSSTAADSLADNPSFTACMERSGDPRDALRVYLNLASALEKFGHYLPVEAKEVLTALGLDRIRGISSAVRFEDDDIVVSSFVDSPGGEDLLTRLMAEHPVDRQFLGCVPADATSFSLFAFDGKSALAQLRGALPKPMCEDLERGLERMRNGGLDLEKEVFEVFGPRCALVTVPYGRPADQILQAVWNQLLGTALVIEVQDPRRAVQVLERLPRSDPTLRRRELMVEGVKAVSYQFDRGEIPMEFALCYALHEGYLVLAASEESLRRMLKTRAPETEKRFRALVKDVPVQAATLTFEDMRNGPGLQFNTMLTAFLQGWRQSRQGGTAPSVTDLPLQVVVEDMGQAVSWTLADEHGILSVTRSPTGGFGSTGGLTGLAMMAAIAIPNLHAARVEANEVAALSALRSISVAQETFQANGFRDDDGDGEGEYGYLVELLGDRRPGDTRVLSGKRLLNSDFMRQGGEWVQHGYYFRVYLPAEDGSPIGEHEGLERIREVDGDLAEAIMVVVAWPMKKGTTGRDAFILGADGIIHVCENGPYSGRRAPPPDVLVTQRGNLASEPLRRGERPRDGQKWTLPR